MRTAFEEKKPEEAWEQDCNIMAAAVWILGYGQTLFKLIVYDHLEEDKTDRGSWWFGDEFAGPPMEGRSIERWRYWKSGFEAVEGDPNASDECRKVALKAAKLMEALEESSLF